MGICGSTSPDIAIVPNKYTLDVDNDCQNKCINAKQSDSSIKINSNEGIVKKTDIHENNKTNKKSDKMLFNIQINNNKKEEKKEEKNIVQNNIKMIDELSFKNNNNEINNNDNININNIENNKNNNNLNVIEEKGTKKRSISTHELSEIKDLVIKKEKIKESNQKLLEIKNQQH